MRRTPPIYARGAYTLNTPWVIPTPVQMYTCIAIRSFGELTAKGIDPYTEYYEPFEVTRDRYESDAKLGATIVTLKSEDGQIYIHVPDTFIASYPDTDGVPYSDIILQVRMSKIPENYDTESLETHMLDYVNAQVGSVGNTVHTLKFPVTERVTVDESVALENARQANITDQETDYVKLQKALADKADLEQQVATLLQVMEDNGYTQ